MARSNDAGHVVNVANFKKAINILTSYGDKYAPVKSQITIAELEKVYTAAEKAIDQVAVTLTAYSKAVSDRTNLFKPLSKQTTQLLNSFLVTDANQGLKDQAKSLADKIRGMNNKTTDAMPAEMPAPADDENKKYSTSQFSFVRRAANVKAFIQLVESENAFRNKPETLTKAFWDNIVNEIGLRNQLVDDSYSALTTARKERDQLLYTPQTGLVDLANNGIKKELKGTFGANSDEYRQISAISFKNS